MSGGLGFKPATSGLATLGLATLGLATLALARLKAAVGLVDDIDPTFAPHETVVAMAATQRFQ
jgi:hypothetical protein